jgi:non-canonical purine NTP pyrophosphatase (RdgB/HAM1 family)
MALFFITGSKNKFAEIEAIVPAVEQLEIDLPEIQSLDPRAILEAKLLEARRHREEAYIVEDTSLYFNGMNGLPGPFIKSFLEALGLEGLAHLAAQYGSKATAKTLIGYAHESGAVEFFDGEVHGTIVPPRTPTGFGWDAIFVPEGYDNTFGELGVEIKNTISMRRNATEKLKIFLEKEKA